MIVGLFAISTNGLLLSPNNVTNILLQYSYILILAIGMVIVIIGGHIDLSVGSVRGGRHHRGGVRDHRDLGRPAVVGGHPARRSWSGWWSAAWQGFWVAYVGIPGFITTLAGMMFFRGANQYIGKSNTVPVPQGDSRRCGA
ncbi:sugar ABC transporter permease, partial [Agrobacterium sp. S2]|nr:sugar ABC transporter permease [Agrobacterium sp. S2]